MARGCCRMGHNTVCGFRCRGIAGGVLGARGFSQLVSTLKNLHAQLDSWGDRIDVGDISDHYNRVRAACVPFVAEELLPPAVEGMIYRDRRIPQLKAYVEQLLAQLAAYRAGQPETEAPAVEPESKPRSWRETVWDLLNQNLVSTIVGGFAVVLLATALGLSQCSDSNTSSSVDNSASSAAAADGALSALTVRFADGNLAVVEFSVVSRVATADAARLVAVAGDRETAVKSLDGPTEAAVRAALGRLTIAEVEQNRAAIEAEIASALQARYQKVGLTLDAVSLGEIRPTSK